jgi:hypothetical protein
MSKLDTHAVEFTLYRHVKTGGLYYIIGLGLLEKDSTPVVLYRGYMKGGLDPGRSSRMGGLRGCTMAHLRSVKSG